MHAVSNTGASVSTEVKDRLEQSDLFLFSLLIVLFVGCVCLLSGFLGMCTLVGVAATITGEDVGYCRQGMTSYVVFFWREVSGISLGDCCHVNQMSQFLSMFGLLP